MEVKREKYLLLLHFGLIYLQNILERSSFDKVRRKGPDVLVQFMHYIPAMMMGDVFNKKSESFFVNNAIPEFIDSFPRCSETQFIQIADLCLELYSECSNQAWYFPAKLQQSITKFKEEQGKIGSDQGLN